MEINVQPTSALKHASSTDGVPLRTPIFSKRTSIATKSSNESFDSEYSQLINALGLDIEGYQYNGGSYDSSIPLSDVPVGINGWCAVDLPSVYSTMLDTHELIAEHLRPDNVALGRLTTDVSDISTRITSAINDCLSSMNEGRVSSQPSVGSHAETHNVASDTEQLNTEAAATVNHQLPEVSAWFKAMHQSQEDKSTVDTHKPCSPSSNGLHPGTRCQRWVKKIKTAVKNKIKAASSAIKQATRRY
jgi:hypothetical protein